MFGPINPLLNEEKNRNVFKTESVLKPWRGSSLEDPQYRFRAQDGALSWDVQPIFHTNSPPADYPPHGGPADDFPLSEAPCRCGSDKGRGAFLRGRDYFPSHAYWFVLCAMVPAFVKVSRKVILDHQGTFRTRHSANQSQTNGHLEQGGRFWYSMSSRSSRHRARQWGGPSSDETRLGSVRVLFASVQPSKSIKSEPRP